MKILVFDVGGTAIKYGMVGDGFELLFSEEMPTNAFYGGNAIMKSIEAKITEYVGEFEAIGISTAGQVDFEKGIVTDGTGNLPNYKGSQLKKEFEAKFCVPVAVDNDVNCAGLGEAYFGAGVGESEFLCLTYGTGVGGCFFQNGDVYRGKTWAAGEFGHMITHVGGRKCTCGKNGCYEAYAACRVFTNTVSERFGRHMSGREIFKEENLKNPIVVEELDNWENEIVYGLISLCNIFNPPLIILGGGIMSEDLLVGHIREKLYANIGNNYKCVRIEKAKLRNKAGMLGAAYLAKRLLDEH